MSTFPDFDTFFFELWRREPFPWQSMLAQRVATGEWPQALDLPTASGKTAAIDIALYALAAQAETPTAERSAARRIWFVVDRRIVVDEAFERARAIADALQRAQNGPLRAVADRLRELSGTKRPLSAARLRGGVLRDDGWGRMPSQPAVITSTVDQLGSQLLFRSYSHGNLIAPIYAGLTGNDSMIILDEAHCSVPFMQTLRTIQVYRSSRWAEQPLSTPFQFVVLSATPPLEIPEDDIFPGAARERALDHPELHKRLHASKLARLMKLKSTGKSGDPLINACVELAVGFRESGKHRIAVMVNRVRTAEEVAARMRAAIGQEADVVLLTGRLRPIERDELVHRWSPYLRASAPALVNKPIVLVSTQCLEVGADFSFDALVTEAASLDAMRQRFGRLHRLGRTSKLDLESTPDLVDAVIVIRSADADPEKSEPDPIYGSALSETWRLIDSLAESDGETGGTIDFGVERLRAKLHNVQDLTPYLAPVKEAPVLLPAHLDLLVQTSPPAQPEPDVQLFLHGKDRSAPEVQVVWRADLPADPETWKVVALETVALCPPVSTEMLSVPLWRLRDFLSQAEGGDDEADIEGTAKESTTVGPATRPFVLWRGRDRSKVSSRPADIRPHDIVIIPARYGFERLGQSGVTAGVGADELDLWERALEHAGQPRAVRLNAAVLEDWSCPPLVKLTALAQEPDRDVVAITEAIDELLAYEPVDNENTEVEQVPPSWWVSLLHDLRNGRIEDHPSGGIVLFEGVPKARLRRAQPDLFADDDDLASVAGAEVSLQDHTELTVRTARKIAERCLGSDFLSVFEISALWHDAGKIDERFQIVLHNGDELFALSGQAPLAKSAFLPLSPMRRVSIRQRSGLPDNFRHEILSLQLAERFATNSTMDSAADLVLHLIASHHGYARPFAPVSLDLQAPEIKGTIAGTTFVLASQDRAELTPSHRVDSGVSDRFWRLVRRYGWWGLAYFEAVMRTADWYASGFISKDQMDEEFWK